MKLVSKLQTINFKNCKILLKRYDGTTKTQSILYDNKVYMLKFQEKKRAKNYLNKPITYFNSIYSEYIACNIGKKIGLNIQETLLGYVILHKDNELKKEYCVACKDFCDENEVLFHVEQLFDVVNQYNKNELNKKSFKDTLKVLEIQNIIKTNEIKKHFYDMFIFDSFIGNFDRNPSNWGIIYNTSNKNYKIAPIYDCGSSMHPKTPRQKILEYFNEFEESTEYINEHAISTPKSFFQINNKKINYYNFLVEKEFNQDKDIAEAILRVVPKLVEIQENGYIEKLVDSLSELMGEDRAKVLKIELEYKAQHMFKEMIRIANKVLEKQKEKEIDDDWER